MLYKLSLSNYEDFKKANFSHTKKNSANSLLIIFKKIMQHFTEKSKKINRSIYIFDILFCHIKSFLRFHLAFGFALQTLFSIDFSKIH